MWADLDEQDDADDLFLAEHDLVDEGRGETSDDDLDECAACGDTMPEYYTGGGGGGALCPDCEDLS